MSTRFLIIITLIYASCFSQQQEANLTDIINIAAKQRMLVQRLAKDKVYIAINENKVTAKKELNHSFKIFEEGIKTLKQFSPNKEVIHKIDLVEFSYDTYKKLITNKSKESMKDVFKYNTLFLNTCDDLLNELLKFSKEIDSKNNDKKESYVIANIANATAASGKLRYLTQRLNLYLTLKSKKLETISPEEIHQIVKDIDQSLNFLTVLEFNTIDIDDSLSVLLYHFDALKKNIYKDGVISIENHQDLFEKCNNVLNKANATTVMYASLGKKYTLSRVANR